ncbi:LysR family transcriptional regulator [Shewanella sp. 10N.286.48.A6]|uniref:LysR family transcriptional regulator n=1 Tax=Shewanella sp. 10N.286.48.A6 TaxID=1880833 RepID=UPI000C81F5FC|nr:LysR family transcriptional regulator [Shewanella sp. 10N.286.48.A6]PMH99018.1 LysR family transcriptional regulator [Shewanella sp. 10N.286.48.A6]
MDQGTKLFDGVVIFTQVIELGSFSLAAEKTGHSTSYVSKTVTKLEQRLNTRLLHRSTRSLSLTAEGKLFYQQCQQMVADAQAAINMIDSSLMTPNGTLKISCPVTFGLQYLQPILSLYMRMYPEVKLDIDFSDRHVDLVQEGYDLAIRATGQLTDSSLICKRIGQFHAHVVATPQYLATHGTPQVPSELTEHQCICYSNLKQPGRWLFEHADGRSETVTVAQVVGCNNADMELAMVLDHHGICRLPSFYLTAALEKQQLSILFEDYIQPQIDIYAVYPSRKHLSPKVRRFIDLLVEHMPSQ